MKKIDSLNTTKYVKNGDVSYLEYLSLNKIPWLVNAFSTREGGVSAGRYAKMNLSYTLGDDKNTVTKNFEIFGNAINVSPNQMVYADQTHTDTVMRVDARNCGMGILKDRDYKDVDGLVTNTPNVCLVTSYADCVPLYFVDPVHAAIGLSHSGWRGTVKKIGTKTIELMKKEFSSDPKDLICCIGPCIGKCCYEVSEEVAEAFKNAYTKEQYEKICFIKEGTEGKYMLDLARANFEQFLETGVKEENISLPDLCTSCNSDLLHSHRASKGLRGGSCAFLMIKEKN